MVGDMSEFSGAKTVGECPIEDRVHSICDPRCGSGRSTGKSRDLNGWTVDASDLAGSELRLLFSLSANSFSNEEKKVWRGTRRFQSGVVERGGSAV
jgi:hypothetical protein